jgi:hypothetical protein
MRAAIIPVAAENNFLSIGRKHSKGIEDFFMAYFLQVASIFINRIQVEGKPSLIFLVAGKYDAFAIGKKSRSPIRLSKMSDLVCIASISVGYKTSILTGATKFSANRSLYSFTSASVFGRLARQIIFFPSGLNQAPPS